MNRVTNGEVPRLVRGRDEFTTGNKTISAQWLHVGNPDEPIDLYVVYSYGVHFPMYIFDAQTRQWYGNKSKYSVTTSRHQTLARPPEVDQWFDTATMRQIIDQGGLVEAMSTRMGIPQQSPIATCRAYS